MMQGLFKWLKSQNEVFLLIGILNRGGLTTETQMGSGRFVDIQEAILEERFFTVSGELLVTAKVETKENFAHIVF